MTESQSLLVLYGFLPVIIMLQSKDNVDKGALWHKVHHNDANLHIVHQLDKQAISLYFVSVFAHSELSKTWMEIKIGWKDVETGYMFKVTERERRTFVWTSAPCTLLRFNFAMMYNTKLMAVLDVVLGFTPRSALFLST